MPSVGSVDARKSIAQYTNQQALTFHHYLASTQQQNHTKSSSATLSGNSSSSNSNEGTSNNSYYPNPNPNPIPDSSINKTDNNDNDDESMLEVVTKAINTPSRKVTEEDVIIASGCSGAVELAISVLLNPGDNILVPW